MNVVTEDKGDLAWQTKRDSDGRSEKKTEGANGGGKSRSRSRSKSSDRNRHHNHRSRRSRSRERSRRSKSKEKRHRSRSRDRSRERRSKKSGRSRKDRSRERRRSHSKERRDRKYYPRRGSEERKSRSKSPFRPKIASKAALKFIAQQSKESLAAKLAEVTGTNNAAETEKPSNLPLNLLGLSGTTTMTPQLVLQQTMAAMSTGLPKYYNPAAVNPLKYAEQMQKRKLLWQSNKEKPESQTKSNSIWAKTHFNQDQDGKMSAKFRKLMGLKEDEISDTDKPSSSSSSAAVSEDPGTGTEVNQKQEALFRDLDQQYEMARITTHTQRGVGLGYSSQPQTLIYPK